MKSFTDLSVWQDAVELSVRVYRVTEAYPIEERYGLAAQTRKAAVSVSSNIAEGKGRSTDRELRRFLDIALGSAFEVHSQLEVARTLGFIDVEAVHDIVPLIRKIHRSIESLKSVVKG